MSRKVFNHTPATDAVIRDGYAKSLPVIELAEALGATRNVVIGRARRLGLSRPWRTGLGYGRFLADPARRDKQKRLLRGPRPSSVEWWANRPADERNEHIRKMLAGLAASRKRGEG